MKAVWMIVGFAVIGGVAAAMITSASRENARREAARQALIREMDAAVEPSTQPAIAAAPIEEAAPEPGPRTGVRGYDSSAPSTPPTTTPSVEPGKPARANMQNQNRPRRQNAPRGAAPPVALDPNADKPIARQALALVGTDPVAEQVWVAAINDPNVSAHDRSDLIEDLNEDGFDDPKNLTPDDLPLIETRLAIIEQIGPDAMDDVNAAAFAEAYKDLVNMRGRVMGR